MDVSLKLLPQSAAGGKYFLRHLRSRLSIDPLVGTIKEHERTLRNTTPYRIPKSHRRTVRYLGTLPFQPHRLTFPRPCRSQTSRGRGTSQRSQHPHHPQLVTKFSPASYLMCCDVATTAKKNPAIYLIMAGSFLQPFPSHPTPTHCARMPLTGVPSVSGRPVVRYWLSTIYSNLRRLGFSDKLVRGRDQVYFISGRFRCWGSF